jgi:hypothetical protein
MLKKANTIRLSLITAVMVFAFQTAQAQTNNATAGNAPDVSKTVRSVAEALGMARRTNRAGAARLPFIDVINRMEIWGSGTSSDGSRTALKTEYHVALSYNPPAVRMETTRTSQDGGAAPQHTIQTVRDNYAWNESQPGAGLEPGWGTATPAMAAAKQRLLQLWILPYGVVKAAIAAGDKTKLLTEKGATENGATVITYPLSGPLAGVTVKATLDQKSFVTKVETQADNPALVIEADYSDYADHGEALSGVQSPGHILQKQGGHPVLDIQIKNWDGANPYLVFPVPENVKKAAAQEPAKAATTKGI